MSKKNVKFPGLKETLREREHTARNEYRKAIREKTGMARWQAWIEKRSYGNDTRDHLLAYGFLRGLPYAACEKKCGDRNYPSISEIARYAKAFGNVEVSTEQVQHWIDQRDAAPAEAPKPEAYADIQDAVPTPIVEPVVAPQPEAPKGFVEGLRRLFKRTA